jgi:hypothetical protein
MTVLQIVKDLIGEEDVNFGDSDTTFNRQTHTGGSTTIHYIDSKSLPANTLGGYVDTYLHTQNTDTGTTQTTFTINSGGNYAKLSSTGLGGDYTYTFPTSGSQALIGATDLASTASSRGASLVGVEDSGGYLAATDVEAALAELAVDIAGVESYRGYKRGFKLGFSSTAAITIGGGIWDHRGTSNQTVYTTSQLTFTLGSAGSNSDSDDVDDAAQTIHYIYIDDSAVVSAGTTLLTASEFLNDTTAPTYSHSKHGWYNGSDRCIGAVLANASDEVIEFYVQSDDLFIFGGTLPEERASAAAPDSEEDLDISSTIPAFSTRARLRITATDDGFALQSANGTGNSPDSYMLASTNADASYIMDVCTSSDQHIFITGSGTNTITIAVIGFWFNEL